MKPLFILACFLLSLHVSAEPAHPLVGMRLILDGASCAGLEFRGDDRMLMYDEMDCSRSGQPTLRALVRAISPHLLLAVEQADSEVAPSRPPRSWIYAYGSVTPQQVILWESWTGWGDLPDEELHYRVTQNETNSPVKIVSMVAGDIACYLTITTPQGSRGEKMANFEICERESELVGKRVTLRYEQSRVQAASCGGDPECSDSEEVSLVAGVTVIR